MNMDVDYRKLWKMLIDKGIKNKTDLIKMAGISTNILAKLGKGEYISMDSMQKTCRSAEITGCNGEGITFKRNKRVTGSE